MTSSERDTRSRMLAGKCGSAFKAFAGIEREKLTDRGRIHQRPHRDVHERAVPYDREEEARYTRGARAFTNVP